MLDIFLIWLCAGPALVLTVYVAYVVIMAADKNKRKIPKIFYPKLIAAGLAGYALDIILNICYATVIYLALPRVGYVKENGKRNWYVHLDYSSRVKDSVTRHALTDYRYKLSRWVYFKMLHDSDPNHVGILDMIEAREGPVVFN